MISEIWLNSDTTPYYHFDGFDAFRVVRGNRTGGGVVIYISKERNGRICETKSTVVDEVLEWVIVEWNQPKQNCISQLYVQVPWFKSVIF